MEVSVNMVMDKTEYKQLVRRRVHRALNEPTKAVHRPSAMVLCDQFTSITEAEGRPRWTFLPETLERAYEAVTGKPTRKKTPEELATEGMHDYADAYDVLKSALEQIFSTPAPSGV